jgi:hypothetical protein
MLVINNTMFIENKYYHWYYNIVNRRLEHPATGYTERHHIIPKSLGGLNHRSNIVRLTAREHFICHRLLTKMTSGLNRQQMFHALACFTKPIQPRPEIKINSTVYQQIKTESALYLSQTRKGRATRPTGTYNHSPETRKKQSESSKGIVKRPRGYRHTSETIELMKQNRSGKNTGSPSWNKGLLQQCPHCGKSVGGTLNRWHGDNCKSKKISPS